MTEIGILEKLSECFERADFDYEYLPDIALEVDECGDTYFDERGCFVLFDVNVKYKKEDFKKIQYKHYPEESYSSHVKITFQNEDWIEILNHEHRVYYNLYGCSSPQGIEAMRRAVENGVPGVDDLAEWIDLYTHERVRSGKMWNRNDEIPEGYYRLVVHTCLFNDDKMLIQQKGPLKENENKWDITAGGGAMYGEKSAEAASRELLEETGILWFFQLEPPHLTLNYGNVINDVYVLEHCGFADKEIKLNKEEVKSVKWATKDEILDMIDSGNFIPYNKNYIELLFYMAENGRGCI